MSLLLLLTPASGAGTGCTAITTTGTGGVPVVAGNEYVVIADFLAATAARNVALGVRWYTGAGASLSSTLIATGVDNTSTWLTLSNTVIAPASAAFAAVYAEVIGAAGAEVHYVDKIGIMEPSLWSLPE